MSKTYLYDIADDILDVAADALAQTRTGHKTPVRSNVSWGAPPNDGFDDDCTGQLTVHLDSPQPSLSHDFVRTFDKQDHMIVVKAHYTITLFRCVPQLDDDGGAPTSEALAQSAQDLLTDLWCLMTGLYAALQTHTLYTGQQRSNDVSIGLVQSLDPQGGYGGFIVRLSVLLNDPGPT